jgi:hypothetical protein
MPEEDTEAAKWLDKMTKNWSSFLLHIVKAISIKNNISSYLTTFDQQKSKWSRLPIHKSKKTYQEVPESMNLQLQNAENATHMTEEEPYFSGHNNQMYQLANIKYLNWYKTAALTNLPGGFTFPSDRDLAYFSGDGDYTEDEYRKKQQRNCDYVNTQDAIKRDERWRKIYDHKENIKELEQKLKKPNITDSEIQLINKSIGILNDAISRIMNATGELSTSPIGRGMMSYIPGNDYE